MASGPYRSRSAWQNGFGVASVLATLALGLALCGMLYETISRRYQVLSIPAPGALINLGGRRIHLDCRGTGSPTVVFESGLDVLGSLSWSRVHDQIAKRTRACAYDRAGFLWSSPQHQRRDAVAIAVELRAVLKRANESGPFLVVGHSEGGAYAMVFAALMKNLVEGVVLVDAVHPDQDEHFARALGHGTELPLWMRARARFLRALGPFWATVGVVRLSGVSLPPDVDERTKRIANAFAPPSREAIWTEASSLRASLGEMGAVRMLGNRPLTILSADPPHSASVQDLNGDVVHATWLALQKDMAGWSTRSRQLVVKGARHHIQLNKPSAVIAAVEEMLRALRK